MGVVYTKKDYIFAMQCVQDFDGSESDSAWRQLALENIDVLPTYEIIRPERSVGIRQMDDDDSTTRAHGSEMLVTVPSYDVVCKDLALWLLCAMQTEDLSEAAATPYSKIFTPHSTQPDFSGDAGYLIHLVAKHPATSQSFYAAGCVVRELNVSLSADNLGRRLMLGATLLARNISTLYQPKGTFSRQTADWWYLDDARRTNSAVTIGSDDVEDDFYGLEFTYTNNAVGVGYDSSGRPINYVLPRNEVSGTLKLAYNTDTDQMFTYWSTPTKKTLTLTLGFGATFGSNSKDLRITIPMHITNVSTDRDNEEVLNVEFQGEKTATNNCLEVTVADGVDIDLWTY